MLRLFDASNKISRKDLIYYEFLHQVYNELKRYS